MSDFSLVGPVRTGHLAEGAGIKIADRPETVSGDRLLESMNGSFDTVQACIDASTLRIAG